MMDKPFPDFSFECEQPGLIAGVDEAGCGPWAGPVVAAAVILNRECPLPGIDDSKKILAENRRLLHERIMETAQVSVGLASVDEIDSLNILQARLLAMKRAIEGLAQRPHLALVDGNRAPDIDCDVQLVIGGDTISLSIAAASIVAKVTRDALMAELATQHPHYGWERNAGYGTRQHQKALAEHGVTPHHRRSFKPIRALLLGTFEDAA